MSSANEYLDGVMKGNRRGRFIVTYSGIKFWPLDPHKDEINIVDIAHSLSMQCRFNGHIGKFYSVAEHSVRVGAICSKENRLCGLLHDASEAYLCDIPTPLKKELPDYMKYEQQLQSVIYEHFRIFKEPEDVKHADKVLLVTEMRDLKINIALDNVEYCPLETRINPWTQSFAKQVFLDCFYGLADSV